MAGFRVKYVLATKLVNELVEAADEKQLTKTIARYGRVEAARGAHHPPPVCSVVGGLVAAVV